MKLSELKNQLDTLSAINIIQPNGTPIPSHFHITEAGLTTKNFIDCGGTVRAEKTINFQVWVANDISHRLEPQKLKKIISTYETIFGTENLEVEIEYQTETISRYGLDVEGENFILTTKETDCLAKESCGVSDKKEKVQLIEVGVSKSSCCTPGGGCC